MNWLLTFNLVNATELQSNINKISFRNEFKSILYSLLSALKITLLPKISIDSLTKRQIFSKILIYTFLFVLIVYLTVILYKNFTLKYYTSFNSIIFKYSKFTFVMVWISILIFYFYQERETALFSNFIFQAPQSVIFVIFISLTLLSLFLFIMIVDLILRNFQNSMFFLGLVFSLIFSAYFGFTINSILFSLIFNCFNVCILLQCDNISDYYISLDVSNVLTIFFSISHFLVPVFILLSILNFLQLKILITIFLGNVNTDNFNKIFLMNFLQTPKGFVCIFILSWTVFTLKNFCSTIALSLFSKKNSENPITLESLVSSITTSFNQIIYSSLIQSFLISCQIFFGCFVFESMISVSSFTFESTIFFSLLLKGFLNYLSSFYFNYNSNIIAALALNLNSLYDDTPLSLKASENFENEFVDDYYFDYSRYKELTLQLLPFISYFIVLKLTSILQSQYTVYIFILFIMSEIVFDFITILSTSFYIAQNFSRLPKEEISSDQSFKLETPVQ